MDFQLTDRQLEVVQAFRSLGRRLFVRESVRQWERDQGLPDEVCREVVDLFYRFPELDPERNPRGALFAQALVTEELSRAAGAALPFGNDVLNLKIMREFGASSQIRPIEEAYRATGRLTFSLAISEPGAGSDTMGMTTTVREEGGKLLLSGRKTFVVNGEYAPSIVVAAIDAQAPASPHPALSFWLIPLKTPGISTYAIAKAGQKILPFSDIIFEDVVVRPEQRLENGARAGFPQLFHLLEVGRLTVCAQSLGLAQGAMDDAMAHAMGRRAFGEAIYSFQQVQEMLVDMEVKLVNMRNMVYHAAWDLDHDASEKRLSVALMKRYVPRAATEVADAALQILGGRGYTENERVNWAWRDCRGNQIAEGTDQIMVRIAAPLLQQRYFG
jgi:alkylation response protein AidB-like acyl-CoA dehydrogenase